MTHGRSAIVLACCGLSAAAHAEPGRLRMRPTPRLATAAAQLTPPTPAEPTTGAPPTGAVPTTPPRARPRARRVLTDAERRLPVSRARLDLGFAVDGGNRSGERGLAGGALDPSIAEVRARLGAEAYAATRAWPTSAVAGYLALRARLAPAHDQLPPVPAAERDDALREVRQAWVEARPFTLGRLRTLEVRAGRAYTYGLAPLRIEGVIARWQPTRGLDLGVHLGGLAPTTGRDAWRDSSPLAVAGVDLRASLAAWRVPLVVAINAARLGDTSIAQGSLAWQPRADVSIAASARTIDGAWANARLALRARLSEVTHVNADLEHRRADDWLWGPAFVRAQDPTAPRGWLQLAAPAARLLGRLRAGTLIADNVDLELHAAFAADATARDNPTSTHPLGYFDLGAAADLRLRRALALGVRTLFRDYERRDGTPIIDDATTAQALPIDRAGLGEEWMIEGALTSRVSIDARRFTALVDLYARQATWTRVYDDASPTVGAPMVRRTRHGGVRVGVDARVSTRLRLRLEYDLSTRMAEAPEISGVKLLRVHAEGTFD